MKRIERTKEARLYLVREGSSSSLDPNLAVPYMALNSLQNDLAPFGPLPVLGRQAFTLHCSDTL